MLHNPLHAYGVEFETYGTHSFVNSLFCSMQYISAHLVRICIQSVQCVWRSSIVLFWPERLFDRTCLFLLIFWQSVSERGSCGEAVLGRVYIECEKQGERAMKAGNDAFIMSFHAWALFPLPGWFFAMKPPHTLDGECVCPYLVFLSL